MMQDLVSAIKKLDQRLPVLLRQDQLITSLNEHKNFLFYLIFIGLLAYSYDIFEFSLHIDSEIDAYKYGPHHIWISEGRWGVYFLNYWLLPDPVIPVIPMLLAIAGSIAGIFFFVKTLSAQRGIQDYLAAAIAVACPIMYFAMYWYSLAYALGIAFALVNLGMFCLARWNWQGWIIAVICFCFGIGVYQAVLLLIVVIFGIYIINSVIEENAPSPSVLIKRTAIFSLALLLAYLSYKFITIVTLFWFGKSFHQTYLGGFVNYELSLDYLRQYLPGVIKTTLAYYTGGKEFYLNDLLPLKILFFTALAVVFYRLLCSKSSVWARLLGIAALILTLFVPASMLLMNSGSMPARTMFSTVFVLAGLTFMMASFNSNLVKSLCCILVVSCFYHFVVINHRYAFSSYLSWQADRDFSLLLLERINNLAYKLPEKDKMVFKRRSISSRRYPLEVVGVREAYSESPLFIQRNAIGASFYTWSANEVRRQIGLFAVMGVFDYWMATRTQRRTVIEAALKMPAWPHEGSVDIINDIIVVKFGNYHPKQIKTLCSLNDDNIYCQKLLAKKNMSDI